MKEQSKDIQFDYPVYDEISAEEKENLKDITAIYLRVSSEMQAKDGYGLDIQYNAIKRYCTAFDLENCVIYVDDGYTGVNTDRPAYQALVQDMRHEKVKLVITYSLDRIGRTQMLILKFLKEDCVNAHCDFYAVKDNVDSRSKQTYGILISILSIFAEFDHDAIVEKLYMGRHQRALDGFWKGGGIPPFGYVYSKERHLLEVDLEKAQTVQDIFKMYNTGNYSPLQIAMMLGLSGEPVVRRILRNRTYLGEITFRGEQYKGVHQALIDEETFMLTQQIMDSKHTVHGSSKYLLSSIAYCGNCGAKLRYMKWGKGKNQKLKLLCYSKYPTSGKEKLVKDPNCPNEIYDAKIVEDLVVEEIMKIGSEFRDKTVEKALSSDKIIEGMQQQKQRLTTEYNRLITAYSKIGEDGILDQAQAINVNIKRIERDIKAEEEKKLISQNIQAQNDLLKTLPDTWPFMDADQRQAVIRKLVTRVVITSGHIKVGLRKEEYEKLLLGKNDDKL